MMRHEGVADIVMLQQDARSTGIFCQYEIDLLQYSDSTPSHVLHIANWRRNNVQYAHFGDKISLNNQNRQKKQQKLCNF